MTATPTLRWFSAFPLAEVAVTAGIVIAIEAITQTVAEVPTAVLLNF